MHVDRRLNYIRRLTVRVIMVCQWAICRCCPVFNPPLETNVVRCRVLFPYHHHHCLRPSHMLLHRHLPHLTGDTRYFLPSLTDHILVRGDRMRTRHPSMMTRTPTTTTTIPIKMKKLKEIEWGQGGQCLSSSTNWPPQVSSLFPFRECLSGQASDPPPPPSLHR